MSSVPTHIIRRQILEFRGVREADALQLQEEIGELFREKILPLLDQYLSDHSPGDIIHRIDLLELDIGTVFRDNLEKDFIEKAIRQLEIYFQPQQSSGSNFIAEKEEIPNEQSHLETFSFFIETGNLPWWADFKDKDPVKESLDFLIRKEESALRHLLYKWVRQTNSLKRIVIQTGFPKWAELAATNLDCTGEELTSMLSQLMDLLKKTTPWNNYPKHKLQEILGLKLLPWVFLSPRKTQNTTDFWNSFLIQLTAGQSITYDDPFAELFLQFEKNKQGEIKQKEQEEEPATFLWKDKTPSGSLQANIFERIKHLLEVKALAPEKKMQWLEYLQKLNEQVVEDEDLQLIIQLLEDEQSIAEIVLIENMRRKDLTIWEEADGLAYLSKRFGYKHKEIAKKIGKSRTTVTESLTIAGLPDDIRRRCRRANINAKSTLLQIARQFDKKAMHAFLDNVENKNLSREQARQAARLEQEAMTEPDKPEIGLLSNKREVSDLTKNPDQQELIKLVKKEKDQFSDTDELFVSNAGLVILFPFLNRFFENLNLLDERRFINAAAAHRAVGLLQCLADGQEVPAEYQCGLNKILCGLDAETVLEFGEPVTAEEAEACQILLEAVIANAPILGEMSVQGFRGSFLIRKGILRAGAGAWQLNVERETFDVVLERFPWNWSIVKLPWMEWAISVEWI